MKLNRAEVKAMVFDPAGQPLPYVVGFDTETCEVEMLLKLADEKPLPGEDERQVFVALDQNMKPFRAKFVLPGAYAINEKGERY